MTRVVDNTLIKNYDDIIYVYGLNNLPIPIGGVITLLDNKTYMFLDNIDLNGDRIVSGQNTTILGASSENCSITSTGLAASTALITTVYTMPMRHITIKDVGTALDIDGTGNNATFNLTGVNFNNVTTIGAISNCNNFIFNKGAFINSQCMEFVGTIGTIAFENSLFVSDSAVADDCIRIGSTATITRRFRVNECSLVIAGSATGLNVSSSATILDEGFILDNCNFSGGSTYLVDLDATSDTSRFTGNRGVSNTSSDGWYYINGNATATTISVVSTPVKVAGTTSVSSITSKFTHTSNRLTYDGSLTRLFRVSARYSVASGNNNQIGTYIAKNGSVIPESEAYVTTDAGGVFENGSVQAVVELSTGDYIEVWTENNTSTTNVTYESLSLTAVTTVD